MLRTERFFFHRTGRHDIRTIQLIIWCIVSKLNWTAYCMITLDINIYLLNITLIIRFYMDIDKFMLLGSALNVYFNYYNISIVPV